MELAAARGRATASAACRCGAALGAGAASPERRASRPSIFARRRPSPGAARPAVLRKRTLLALSRAIEDEALASAAAPLCFGAFQDERFYRAVEPRYQRASRRTPTRRSCSRTSPGRGSRTTAAPSRCPLVEGDALGNEWAVVVDAPGYAACLLGVGAARARAPDADGRVAASSPCGRPTRRAYAPRLARVGAHRRAGGPTPRWASASTRCSSTARSRSRRRRRCSPRSRAGWSATWSRERRAARPPAPRLMTSVVVKPRSRAVACVRS